MNEGTDKPSDDASSDSAPEGSREQPMLLRCLAGGALPDEHRKNASRLSKLSTGVLKDMGLILRDCVLKPMTQEISDKLGRFCVQHEVAEADLGGVLKVCGWLLHRASELDLPASQFVEDVRSVFGDASEIGPILQAEYGPFKAVIREQLLSEALISHGKVLVDVDWRVDRILSERQAAKLDIPVALVTLAYRDTDGPGRLTLQMTAERLHRLAQMFEALAQKTQWTDKGTAEETEL